ncbi:hypothetical protein [Cochleicola gelatinilyticus]|uniref:Phage portal protein n=1 Tax=Cochleicola gelatinilyticus TaxID=1763537 RepID=A0A167HMQ1_9FLAO|nr:hypothetical protein [Cochleicola gelatinilyticus]OAB78778.1 hypothetical protein ULVI_09355 [Cochleicola gelatinilyticus]
MKIYNAEVEDSILSVKYDKRNGIYNWGLDNLQPQLLETLINMSVSATACVNLVAKHIYGKSFGETGNKIVNNDNQTLNEILRCAAREYAKHNNCFIHISYNLLHEITSIKVLPSMHCRLGEKDDLDFHGKIIYYDNWDKKNGKVDESKYRIYDRFNPNINVINAQIQKAGSISRYKGQCIHLQKDSNSIYSLSNMNSVMGECIVENNSMTFRRRGSEKGFLLSKAILTAPMTNEDDRKNFHRTIDGLQGAKNAGNFIHFEAPNHSDNLDSQIKLQDISSEYQDNIFEYSDRIGRKNIALANGVPLGLIDSSESSLFGNSGALLKSMKLQLWEAKEEERDILEEALSMLMNRFHIPIEGKLEIINPYEQIIESETTEI